MIHTHFERQEVRADVASCNAVGISRTNALNAWSIGLRGTASCENRSGPAGGGTPVDPALDQHASVKGSASRG